jgi:hypothetical protein
MNLGGKTYVKNLEIPKSEFNMEQQFRPRSGSQNQDDRSQRNFQESKFQQISIALDKNLPLDQFDEGTRNVHFDNLNFSIA